ncbi:ABC transporter permease [Nocardia sp. NPDC050175]|uniref:ABC transporter permease n=1 Tax=Nocardia sp. NPDC050175 TaxID=3364317 RepID=UPI0037A19D83
MRWTIVSRRLSSSAAKLLLALGVLLIVAFLTYAVFYLLPADPAQLACGKPCTPDNLLKAQLYMGLDHPWYQQFFDFVAGVVVGRSYGSGLATIQCAAPCFGYSFQQNESVASLIFERFPITLSIAIGAGVLWLILGVGAGLVAARRQGKLTDRVVTSLAALGLSTPTYLLGLLVVLLFGFTLNVIPVSGYVPLSSGVVQWAWHLVAAWIVLALVNAAMYARISRNQLIEIFREDFIRTARANGLTERRIVFGHAVRNILAPILTLFAVDLGALLGGAVITEQVFGMPGLGRLLIDAVHTVDLPVIVGITIFSAAIVLVANFLIDAVLGLLDPRVK